MGAFATPRIREVGISGDVSFTATRVDATVKVYQLLGKEALGTNEWAEKSKDGGIIFTSAISGADTTQTGEDVDLDNKILSDANLTAESHIFRYKVVITSQQERDLFYKFTEEKLEANTSNLAGFTVTQDSTTGTVDKTTGATIIVTVTIVDPAKLDADWKVELSGNLELATTSFG